MFKILKLQCKKATDFVNNTLYFYLVLIIHFTSYIYLVSQLGHQFIIILFITVFFTPAVYLFSLRARME